MKLIPLSQGKFAMVDDEDFDYLSSFKWRILRGQGGHLYDSSFLSKKTVLMHRLILKTPKFFYTDHINGNGLDNRSENIRICTPSENNRNRALPINNTSGFKGVNRDGKRWRARIMVGFSHISLGLFLDKESAARAYDEAAKKHHGKFANLNFP